jgi:hypothetical protein
MAAPKASGGQSVELNKSTKPGNARLVNAVRLATIYRSFVELMYAIRSAPDHRSGDEEL